MKNTAFASPKPVLLVAAESIAIASGMTMTVADVLRARALKHYTAGLRQYLTIRLGSAGMGEHALSELSRRLESWSSEALSAKPGPRAHLYRLARSVAADLKLRASAQRQELFWMLPAGSANHAYLEQLSRVRRELDPDDAELLELRYARELAPEELAYVVDRGVEDVVTALERAASRAAGILGQTPPSRLGGLRGALQEAFALNPVQGASSSSLQRKMSALPQGTVIGERYAVQERVGEGSFGDVYRALDTDVPGHVVALKILHRTANGEEARKSALRELRLIASVFHPSVVDFKDHGWYRERLWFVMPWYDGETLEDRIKRGPLSRAEAQEIFVPLAQALATMHAVGIRHQDVKPDNIFLARIGDAGSERQRVLPVLIDLGVAAKEAEMIVAGTPLYFPPEIAAQYAAALERPTITTKADVFSLALSLRNALEPETQEQVPGTAVEAFIAHRADHPPTAPEASELKYLEPYFVRWLAKDANQRPTAQQMAEELLALTQPERQRERRRAIAGWAAPIAAGALVAISSLSYVTLRERDAAMAARLRADRTQSKLGIVSQRSAALEESYAHSELTRQELGEKLAARAQEVKRLAAQVIDGKRENDAAQTRIAVLASEAENARREVMLAQRKLESQSARMSSLEGDLFSTQQRHALSESELREMRARLSSAEQELDGMRVRARTLLAELDRARAEANHQLGRAATLEETLSSLQRDRSRAQRDLAHERQRAADLAQQVREFETHDVPHAGEGPETLLP
jgi:eukaryotic-like serine/threonine-protein kinase